MSQRWLWALLAVQVVLGLLYSLVAPVFEVSDELWHFAVVRELAEGRGLPVQDPAVTTPWEQEGSQPPLYYATAALLISPIDLGDYDAVAWLNPFARTGIPGTPDNVNMVGHPPGQSPLDGGTVLAVFVVRWFSVLLGTLTAGLTWALARTVFPKQAVLPLLAAALVAFTPMVLHITASVNNDALLMPLATLGLLLLVRDVQDETPGFRWRATALLGVVMGLAALTKLSGLVLLPLSAFTVTVVCWQQRDWRPFVVRGTLLVALVAAIAGWWYVRNLALYGEPFGTATMAAVAGPHPPGYGLPDLLSEWRSFWYAFWGLFGVFTILAPGWFYGLATALSLAGAAGVARLAWRHRAHLGDAWPHLLLLGFVALSFVTWLNWALTTQAAQGRLLFGGIAVFVLYLALGLLSLLPERWQPLLAVGLSSLWALVAAGLALLVIRPVYLPAPALTVLPVDATPANVVFDDRVRLVGYRVDPLAVVPPGDPLAVTLFWTTDAPIGDDLNLTLTAFGDQLAPVAKRDTWPGGGLRPTRLWQPGEVYADRYLLAVDVEAATPSRISLDVSFWQGDPDSRLPLTVDGAPTEAFVLPRAGRLAELPSNPRFDVTRTASTFDGGLVLSDYEVLQQPGAIELLTVWTTGQAVGSDLTVFVHLVDASGTLVAQADGPPRAGFWPTDMWLPGGTVIDVRTVDLPDDLPAGDYRLLAGLYDPLTGARLPAYDAQAQPWPNAAIELAGLRLP